jgi:PHD/YefM family antitoxin component YafN of YafNO toxin-antitoxin module
MNIKEQIVVDKNGKPVAVQIPIDQYKKMLEIMEEMEDIKAYKKAKKSKSEWISFEEAFAALEKKANV